jgi:epoxyqueuosine reductase
MSKQRLTPEAIRERLIALAHEQGISAIGLAAVDPLVNDRQRLLEWLTRGYQASMAWMNRDPDRRTDVQRVLPGARTVISIAVNYNTGHSPCDDCGAMKISRYAWGEDYHDVLTRKLGMLEHALREWAPGEQFRSYVDTGPLMEKAWAQRAGIGWIGKNTNLINREFGSWVFLGEILTTLALPPDNEHLDFCGSCTRCLDACPTDAFPEPYVLDSNKCISYWTIEHRGDFPEGVAEQFDGWIFGCDVCQDVCPWNKFSPPNGDPAFIPTADVLCPPQDRWLGLSDQQFREEFSRSPIKRARVEGLTRNIVSQKHDPLESALKSIVWEPIDTLEDIPIEGFDA